MRLMTVSIFATLAALVCSIPSFAQGEPKDLLLGQWESDQAGVGGKVKLDFAKETMKMSVGVFKCDCPYTWADKDTIEIIFPADKKVPQKTKIVVAKETLSLTDMDGTETKFTRVK